MSEQTNDSAQFDACYARAAEAWAVGSQSAD